MGKISNGNYKGKPAPGSLSGWVYILGNFDYLSHPCDHNCSCSGVGCGEHWTWKSGAHPKMLKVDEVLNKWSAYRGNYVAKRHALQTSFESLVELVLPLRSKTIVCGWDDGEVERCFDQAKTKLCDSTVLTAKTLYFLVPDLFLILDRKQVWPVFRQEVPGLPWNIDKLNGQRYVKIMQHVQKEISVAVNSAISYTVTDTSSGRVLSVGKLRRLEDFRLVSPIGGAGGPRPNTLGQVTDNIMRDSVYI